MKLEKTLSCCKWRICSIFFTTIISAYTDDNKCTQQPYSRMGFSRTRCHEIRTFSEKISFLIDKEASKLWCVIGLDMGI